MDTGAAVDVTFSAEAVPSDATMRALLPRAVMGDARPEDQAEFARLWQDRVARILMEHWDDPRLVRLTTSSGT